MIGRLALLSSASRRSTARAAANAATTATTSSSASATAGVRCISTAGSIGTSRPTGVRVGVGVLSVPSSSTPTATSTVINSGANSINTCTNSIGGRNYIVSRSIDSSSGHYRRSYHSTYQALAKLNVKGLASRVDLTNQRVLMRVDLNVPTIPP
mmetsp:Transcript_21822/g.47215  ORF Transcript_21822/g.47215 Transcript_21822/m.47215 type:complete len:154 (-) Transcript_21822:26-487(-)